jgi:DNA-binding MarR family transcriptional regulator
VSPSEPQPRIEAATRTPDGLPTPAGIPDTLWASTGFLLTRAAQHAIDLAEAALTPLDLKARHYGVLVALDAHQPTSQHQLSQILRIDRTTMVAIVDYLETRGLVERGLNPTDRRTHRVRLTSAGRTAMQRARTALAHADAELVARLSADERAQLTPLLHKLCNIGAT